MYSKASLQKKGIKMLKKYFAVILALFLSLSFVTEASAKRIGGGRSLGMQRSNITPRPAQAPSQQQQIAPRPATPSTPAPAQSGWRKWGGALAGLAAGIGLAALLSHFGVGGEFAGIILAVIVAVVVFALLRRLFAKNSNASGYQYAGANQAPNAPSSYQTPAAPAYGGQAAPVNSAAMNIPAGFDVADFEHQAKVQFIRLQAANDAGNIQDIREFTSPEMFAEIKLEMESRHGAPQRTDVVELNANLLDVSEEANRYIASVRYHGLLREEKDTAPQSFDEIWNLAKPKDGSGGWVLYGIQQTQ